MLKYFNDAFILLHDSMMKNIPKQKYIPTHFHHLILTLVFLYLINRSQYSIYYTLGSDKKILLGPDAIPQPPTTRPMVKFAISKRCCNSGTLDV